MKNVNAVHKNETPDLICGEGGIRTLDTALRPYDGLANR